MTDYEIEELILSDAETEDENDRDYSYEDVEEEDEPHYWYIEGIKRYELYSEDEYYILDDPDFKANPKNYKVERIGSCPGIPYLVRIG